MGRQWIPNTDLERSYKKYISPKYSPTLFCYQTFESVPTQSSQKSFRLFPKMSKPYFLIVPGSFSLPTSYDYVVASIREKGYEIKALTLPTTGLGPGVPRETPFVTMYEDAALIAKEVEALADAGKEIVLMAHSYGGFPATESTKGLTVEERRKEGKKGGIVRIAYLTVLLGSLGQKASDVLGNTKAWDPHAVPNGWMSLDVTQSAKSSFSDMPEDQAMAWSATFVPHSIMSFTNPLTHAGYKDAPVSYLLCEEDLVIPSELQRKGIDMIERETGKKVDVTSIKTGHCPVISAPQLVVDWLLGLENKVE
ncbi:alpha/beta-hydrolase [Xylaria intraflava]|nr:alpha/beta-hydrolase [Xylaria intraflava]